MGQFETWTLKHWDTGTLGYWDAGETIGQRSMGRWDTEK
jgi:hypothetical protein